MKKFWNFVKNEDTSETELYFEGPISDETWLGDEITPTLFRDEGTSTDEFIGKIRCGICGNVLRRYCSYGKYHYWYCPGKSKVRTECNAQDLADCNLRTVSAYIMGTEEFDASEFAKQVKEIIVQKDGSLKYYFYDGSEKTWQKM